MKSLFFMLCFSVAACGGAIDDPFDGGGTDGGGNDASTEPDAAQIDASPPTQDGGGPSCDALAAQLATEAQSAEQCCPTCNIVQCTQQVEGLCCPLSVSQSSSTAVQAYEATLQEFHAAGCAVNCPNMPCTTKPTGMCEASGTCAQF